MKSAEIYTIEEANSEEFRVVCLSEILSSISAYQNIFYPPITILEIKKSSNTLIKL